MLRIVKLTYRNGSKCPQHHTNLHWFNVSTKWILCTLVKLKFIYKIAIINTLNKNKRYELSSNTRLTGENYHELHAATWKFCLHWTVARSRMRFELQILDVEMISLAAHAAIDNLILVVRTTGDWRLIGSFSLDPR